MEKVKLMKKNRRIQLLKHKDTRIVTSRTKETDMMLDLAQKTDDIFFKLRNMAGLDIDYEKTDAMLEAWTKIMIHTSEALNDIATSIEMEYIEPSSISLSKEEL